MISNAHAIEAIFKNKLSIQDCEDFVNSSKSFIHLAKYKTAEKIVPSLMILADDKITEKEAYKAYIYLTEGGLSYSGGDGLDSDNPVIITTSNSLMGIPAEYAYISKGYGNEGEDWQLKSQAIFSIQRGFYVDKVVISLANGKEITVYFDVTSFYGKF